jgi:prevent-host-death family protein
MSQVTVGISRAQVPAEQLRQVKSGASLTITEHGKPVGQIVPVRPSLEARLQQLAQSQVAAWSGRRLTSKVQKVGLRGRMRTRPTTRSSGLPLLTSACLGPLTCQVLSSPGRSDEMAPTPTGWQLLPGTEGVAGQEVSAPSPTYTDDLARTYPRKSFA